MIICKTVIGSHIWNMNHEFSDLDLFVVETQPISKILRGKYSNKSKFVPHAKGYEGYEKRLGGKSTDVSIHSAQTTIEQLIKMNLNFLVGIMSPIPIVGNFNYEILKGIVKSNLSKRCYYPIRGMATHNMKKYIYSDKDNTNHRRQKIYRVLRFGIGLLRYGEFEFRPSPQKVSTLMLEETLESLDIDFDLSDLPERTDEEPFRDWLENVRLMEMKIKYGRR